MSQSKLEKVLHTFLHIFGLPLTRDELVHFLEGMSWQEKRVSWADPWSLKKKDNASMLIWTIQSYQVWEKLQQDGFLYGPGPDLVDESWQWRIAYEWMAEQMERRIGKRPRPDIYPLWAWYQWRDATHRKPDLRSPGHLTPGTKGVRLGCEIPTDHILLSDFVQWHHALNYGYLSLSQAEEDAFEAELAFHGVIHTPGGPLSDPVYHQSILDSWQRIFDLDSVGDPDWLGDQTQGEKSIQGTFWQLSLDQVRAITVFTSRHSRSNIVRS